MLFVGSISLTNMNFIRAIKSAARAASQSHSIGSNKLETITQNKGQQTYTTVALNRSEIRNNQPALPCSLQRRCIRLCPQRPVQSAAYSYLLLLLLIDFFVDCAFPWVNEPWVQLVRQRRTPLMFLSEKCAAGRDSTQALFVTSSE